MWARSVLYAGSGLFLIGLLSLVVTGPTGAILALGVAGFVVAVAGLGPERVGLGLLGAAFVTAPFYKGLGSGHSTPTDLLLALAVVLLFPRLLLGRSRLAPPYVLGVTVVALTGTAASLASAQPVISLLVLVQWMICLVVLPRILISLHLSLTSIDRLAWAFVAGHMVSTAYALVKGPVGDGGRYLGLTQHPNAFAQSGLLAFGLLLHLITRTERRWIAWAALGVSLLSIYLSGSRGGTVAVALLILMIPVIERSALVTYFLAFAGVGALLALQQLVGVGDAGGSISRLTGSGSASASDTIRSQNLGEGLHRFHAHPILGNGLLDLFWIHNNYVEVAVAVGVIGLIAYLVVIWSLGRGLLGRSELRRLCYPVAGYAVFGATIPSLTDRSIWMAVSLSVAVFHGFREPAQDVLDRSREPAPTPPTPTPTLVALGPGRGQGAAVIPLRQPL